MIIVITQLVQQKPDFVGAAPGRADESQPGRHFHLTVCDCFEEPALELAFRAAEAGSTVLLDVLVEPPPMRR